ncbi:MAG: hypothetical protein ACP5I8_01635 [Phycisphaerae bacterium]
MTRNSDRFTDPLVITILKPSEVDVPEFQEGYKAGQKGDLNTEGKGLVWKAGWESGIDEHIAELKKSIGDKGKRPYMRMAMATKGQFTGMRGVYLVAAELSRLGLIASPTSRSAKGADILVTTGDCMRAFSVQVKSNAKTFNFWLVGKDIPVSPTHIYVFVNLRAKKGVETVDFYVVPSTEVAKRVVPFKASTGSEWHSFFLKDAHEFKDNWKIFEAFTGKSGKIS